MSECVKARGFDQQKKRQWSQIPLVLPYYAGVSQRISRIIYRNGEILTQDPDIGFLFKDNFVTALKNDKNVKQLVVRSKLPADSDEIPGNFPCGNSRCKTCDCLSSEPLVSGPNGSFMVRKSFTCTDRGVIYAIQCLKCNVLYIGETGRTLRDRKNNHFSDIRCKKTDKSDVAAHFCSSEHSLVDDFSIRAIHSIHDTHERTLFESKLIKRLGTLYPNGMNREDNTSHRR